ncbi:MAG: GNAT family N-acetyltransferase [Lachnospiraceae bacterium]|nr:GNAT family N-acetyltransferase [Lachnospiraceae bacterium]
MKIKVCENGSDQKKFLAFRSRVYRDRNLYIDNHYFMLKEIFSGKLHFMKSLSFSPVMVVDDREEILCEGIIAVADSLPEYVQLCFFEALNDTREAAALLVGEAEKTGKRKGCERLVVGLYGHVNYGLGLQDSHFESANSFSSPGNPKFYNDYFRGMGFGEVKLNSYFTHSLDGRLMRYQKILEKLNREYEFRPFDKKQFEKDTKIYTDLNNRCFMDHKYYFARDPKDDAEMLKELFLFMKEDSLIFAFQNGEPAGFILWYPDYNELAKPGEALGTKHYFKNLFENKRIKTAKVMEYGVLEEYRGVGLPFALIAHVYDILSNYGVSQVESSWILADNEDSNSFCRAFCDELYKEYVVYEKDI